MKTYSERKYYFYHTKVSFEENGRLLLERKTLLSLVKETIPLVSFSPESQVSRKSLSIIAQFFLTLEVLVIGGFFITLFKYPDYLTIINIPLTLMFISIFLLSSLIYYLNETKSRLTFYYHNDSPAFSLSYQKKNSEQTKWRDRFKVAVLNERVNFDQENFIKIRKGIESLKKQNLISKEFFEELLFRLGTLEDVKIRDI
ncbi:hypothetical protein Ldro_1695 [Legionella drozanskii LLAP-1]|uniref:Uncharacterized protein n=1 Tax=Legionella drozanskii LLAP-1 TaxID=1212489 RepID=A0A0W0SXU5_9GAMM|nr:hypothetical protein [Legionella drozanskii]KTC88076.1 hypothetical protein Ldro_1695 [Legionella drozanskii LLAP-1]